MKKDKYWLSEQVGGLNSTDAVFNESGVSYIDTAVSTERVYELIYQLDEPEVLSLEWIDENKKDSGVHYIGYYVPIGRLHDLLVPKQEKIKVPDWFAEWCKGRVWGDGFHEGKAFTRSDVRALVQIADGEDLHGLTQEQADEIYGDFFKYLDAFFYGYEVEEEQKYIISINITDKDSKTNYETFLNKRGIFHSMENDSFNSEEFNWSEEEIRGLTKGDILFEHFAVKVEELEE